MSTILVVDDNELVSKLLREALNAHGYDVLVAPDANQAYLLIKQYHPDLIILDVVLPDVSGIELCQTFRRLPDIKHTPIILITGTAISTGEKVKGLRSGADDYIVKPFEIEEVLERVSAVLRRSEPRTPLSDAPVKPSHTPREPPRAEPSPMTFASSLHEAVECALFSPQTLTIAPPVSGLAFVVSLMSLVILDILVYPGVTIKPLMACVLAALLWAFSISLLVVASSISGISLTWKEGARLLSLSGIPILMKLAGAFIFSAWSTLSPALFTASPLLFSDKMPSWIGRLDAFELWTVALLAIALQKRPGSTRIKVALVTFVIWALTAVALAGLLRVGGGR